MVCHPTNLPGFQESANRPDSKLLANLLLAALTWFHLVGMKPSATESVMHSRK